MLSRLTQSAAASGLRHSPNAQAKNPRPAANSAWKTLRIRSCETPRRSSALSMPATAKPPKMSMGL